MSEHIEHVTKEELKETVHEIAENVPGLIRGPVEKPFQKALDVDNDHDGESDAVEFVNLAIDEINIASELSELIDFEDLMHTAQQFGDHLTFIKDKERFFKVLAELAKRAEVAQKFLPKK